jgi:hypothetical protein
MKKNKIACLAQLCVLLVVLLAVSSAFAQALDRRKEEKPKIKTAGQALPEQWNGIWKGITVNVNADGKREEIPMELKVLPVPNSSAKTWKILYGKNAGQTTRPYEIMPVSNEPNRFVVDEKNGLFIDNQLVGNVLYSQFTVTTNLVTTRFELKGDEIRVEMMMFDLRSPRQSKLSGGNIEVSSYRFRLTQFGILRREINKK